MSLIKVQIIGTWPAQEIKKTIQLYNNEKNLYKWDRLYIKDCTLIINTLKNHNHETTN